MFRRVRFPYQRRLTRESKEPTDVTHSGLASCRLGRHRACVGHHVGRHSAGIAGHAALHLRGIAYVAGGRNAVGRRPAGGWSPAANGAGVMVLGGDRLVPNRGAICADLLGRTVLVIRDDGDTVCDVPGIHGDCGAFPVARRIAVSRNSRRNAAGSRGGGSPGDAVTRRGARSGSSSRRVGCVDGGGAGCGPRPPARSVDLHLVAHCTPGFFGGGIPRRSGPHSREGLARWRLRRRRSSVSCI